MGYRVDLDNDSRKLIDLISTDPAKVFGRSYAAFMLFLLGEADEEAINWFLRNARVLDSLTGEEIAYAVFAKSFKIRVSVAGQTPYRQPQMLGELEMHGAPHEITRLIRRGRFGWVVDGDEIIALTYGTDIVAKQLDLLDKLPCVVVVDAVPSRDPCIIRLENRILDPFVGLLRGAIGDFVRSGGLAAIRHDAAELHAIQNGVNSVQSLEVDLNRRLDRELASIERLTGIIENETWRDDLWKLRRVLEERKAIRDEIVMQLENIDEVASQKLAALEERLHRTLQSLRDNKQILFSAIMKRKCKEHGAAFRLEEAKRNVTDYLSKLFHPDFLTQIWSLLPL